MDFTPSEDLRAVLERMSRDTTVPVEGLVNQAVFNWARLHGYATPTVLAEAPPPPPPVVPPVILPVVKAQPKPPPEEPETARVPVVEDPFESTIPQLKRQPRLVLIVGEREVPVDSDRFLIGRDVSCNLTIEAPRISRQHAVIHIGLLGPELQDLGSSNGTWFEGERIERRQLKHGDLIHFGDSPVRVLLR